jgi:hypothetical protein
MGDSTLLSPRHPSRSPRHHRRAWTHQAGTSPYRGGQESPPTVLSRRSSLTGDPGPPPTVAGSDGASRAPGGRTQLGAGGRGTAQRRQLAPTAGGPRPGGLKEVHWVPVDPVAGRAAPGSTDTNHVDAGGTPQLETSLIRHRDGNCRGSRVWIIRMAADVPGWGAGSPLQRASFRRLRRALDRHREPAELSRQTERARNSSGTDDTDIRAWWPQGAGPVLWAPGRGVTQGENRRLQRCSRRGDRPSDLRERPQEAINAWYTVKGVSPLCALRTHLGSRHAMTF